MDIAKRMGEINDSPIRKFYGLANEAEKNGKKIYYLNIGQPDIQTPSAFFKAVKGFNQSVLSYAPTEGIPELREAISNYYKRLGIEYEPTDILVTTGGSEALVMTFMAILNSGDEVIIPEPFYPNYATFIKEAGGKIVPLTTNVNEGYSYANRKKIEAVITDKTKAFCLGSPANPTGSVLSKEDMRLICDIAKENNIYIIADEVYREFLYDGSELSSFGMFEDMYDHVIMIDSVSKRFSLCGARIGCLATKNSEIMKAAVKLAQSRLSVATLDQVGSAALYNLDASYYDNVREEYEERRDVLYKTLKKIDGVECKPPKGAFYITVKLPVPDAEEFLVWLLSKFSYDGASVMFAPAKDFYTTEGLGKDEVRLAYVLNKEDLLKAADILKYGISEYNKEQ